MAGLYLDTPKNKVQVAELALIGGKQQMVLGGLEQDLILRTAGNIQIQVGNKFYPLTYTVQSNNSATITSDTTILALESDLKDLVYPGDGNYVFIQEDNAFYITSNNTYIKINGAISGGKGVPIVGSTTLYLSYTDAQKLTGSNKLTLILNTGQISTFNDIVNYTKNDVYINQLLYNISTSKYYVLTDINNPSIQANWQELFLSLITGGNILNPVSISVNGSNLTNNSALHIAGNAPQLFTIPTAPTSLFSLGAIDYSTGLANWTNNGNVYYQLLNDDYHSEFSFITKTPTGSNNLLNLSNNTVGINAPVDYNYNLIVGGNTNFLGSLVQTGNTKSSDFLHGQTGFSISKDSSNLWTIETDNLIVRNKLTFQPQYQTYSINGAQIASNDIVITYVDFVETFPIYIHANISGKYLNTSGTVRTLSSRATNAYVIHIPIANLDTPGATQSYELISLAYGIGDYYSGPTLDTTTTYNKDISTTYYTPTGNIDYSGGSFIAGTTLLQINAISVYYINTSTTLSVGDLLYYKAWNSSSQFTYDLRAQVVLIGATGYYIYVYDGATITSDTRFTKIGNTAGTGAFLQTNSMDQLNPFNELASGITSFNNFIQNYYYSTSTDYPDTFDFVQDNWTNLLNTRVKIGDLSNMIGGSIPTFLGLTTQQYGLYSDNAFIKGSFIINNPTTALGYVPANDALVVHLAGTESITGSKLFSLSNYLRVTNAPTNDLDVIRYSDFKFARNAANFGLSASLADVGHYTDSSGSDQTYTVAAWLNLLTATGQTVTIQVTWTDNHSVSQTKTFYPQGATTATLSTVANYALPSMNFRALGSSTIQVSTTVSGVGSILYECGTSIQLIVGH